MKLYPECHHAYLIRRVDRLYHLIDVEGKYWLLPELQAKIKELKLIEG